jgi:hypothetical protein
MAFTIVTSTRPVIATAISVKALQQDEDKQKESTDAYVNQDGSVHIFFPNENQRSVPDYAVDHDLRWKGTAFVLHRMVGLV